MSLQAGVPRVVVERCSDTVETIGGRMWLGIWRRAPALELREWLADWILKHIILCKGDRYCLVAGEGGGR